MTFDQVNTKNRSVFLGIEIGDTHDRYEEFTDYIQSNYDLGKLGFVLVYVSKREVGESRFYEWARFFRDNDIYFAFLYTQQRSAPEGRISHLTKEIVKNIEDIAGEYFVGDMIGETGGLMSWFEDYFINADSNMPKMPTDLKSYSDAKRIYTERVKAVVDIDRGFDVKNVLAVEATTASRYNFDAGVDVSFMEMLCADPEIMMSSVRGASRGYGRRFFGAHMAHEWYGGLRVDDPMKYNRLRVAYRYAYLSGARFIYPESGDFGIRAYGFELDKDHEFCRRYRKEWSDFADLIEKEPRLGEGPKVTFAFIQGRNDPYIGWGNKTAWNQFGREEWGYSDGENAWRILDTVTRRDKWHTVENFGENDLSAYPAYGQYDILPIEASVDVMNNYTTLVFAGRNAMTEELLDKLSSFVENGGTLFMTASHLSTADSPEEGFKYIGGEKAQRLMGFAPDGKTVRRNSGYKFVFDNLFPDIRYPAAKVRNCDPILPGGFAEYLCGECTTGKPAAYLSDSFLAADGEMPVLIENEYGKGRVITLLTTVLPGNNAVFPVYSRIVKCIMNADKLKAEVSVLAVDDISYAVYENDTDIAVYLLNTNYDCKNIATVRYLGEEKEIAIPPMELASVKFKKANK